MHQYRAHVLGPCPGGCSDEGQDGQSVFWDAHVWPLGVVIVEDRVFYSLLGILEVRNKSVGLCMAEL